MLKLYVGAKIRIQESAEEFAGKLEERRANNLNEDGFASAEMIGLSVVGVLIAFGIYKVFQTFIGGSTISDWLEGIFTRS